MLRRLILLPSALLVTSALGLTVTSVGGPMGAHAAGSTCVVTPQRTGPYPTIESALNTPSCATIRLVHGTYDENVRINRDVTILGLGPNLTTVNGGGVDTVFTIDSGTVTLSGLTITNGSAYVGGGIYNETGTVTISNSTISGNTAGLLGGGILNYRGTLTVSKSTISGNAAGLDGGGIFNYLGMLSLTNTQVVNNTPDDCVGC